MALKTRSVGISRLCTHQYGLGSGRSSSPCRALQRRKTQQRGQQHIWFWFFLYEQRLFWGSLALPLYSALGVLEPRDQIHVPSCREGALLSYSWLGGQEPSWWCPDGLQPLAAGMRVTRLAGACSFWARNQRPPKQPEFSGQRGDPVWCRSQAGSTRSLW